MFHNKDQTTIKGIERSYVKAEIHCSLILACIKTKSNTEMTTSSKSALLFRVKRSIAHHHQTTSARVYSMQQNQPNISVHAKTMHEKMQYASLEENERTFSEVLKYNTEHQNFQHFSCGFQ